MTEEARKIWRQLNLADWTLRAGQPEEGARVLGTWAEAAITAVSTDTDNVLLEEANLIRDAVQARAPQRYREWNDINTDDFRRDVQLLVAEKLSKPKGVSRLPPRFIRVVPWSILHMPIECHFASVLQRRFFRDYVQWFVKGHIPCGWEGEAWPKGRPVIF